MLDQTVKPESAINIWRSMSVCIGCGEGETSDMCHYVMTMSSIWVESESAARPGLSAY